MMERKGTEGFYLDENGVKQDRDFHEKILDNPEADLACKQMSARSTVEKGIMTKQDACVFFGVPEWTDNMTYSEWIDHKAKERQSEPEGRF